MEIKKAVIPLAGLGTRFLPLAKAMPKELWPLVDLPIIQYIINEAKDSGISEIIFVLNPENKIILDYLRPSPKIEKVLKERKEEKLLAELKKIEELSEEVSFSHVFQKKPLGDGHALLQAAKLIGEEPAACLFGDDVVEAKTPALLQLAKVFKTCQKPVIALYHLAKEKLPFYGIAGVERIASRLYKIKKIIEKPAENEAPSDLAIIGKYILTPEVFEYLRNTPPNQKGEIILANAFDQMLKDGKLVYGGEIEGRWLECGNKLGWLKSQLYLSLKDPRFGPKLKEFLKEIKL